MHSLTLGEKIQQLRTNREYSQSMLANLLGVSRQCIGHYESDRRVPNLVSLIKLAEIFEVPVDTFISLMPREKNAPFLLRENNFLIGIHEDNIDFTNLTPMEVELLNSFRDSTDDGRKAILEYAKRIKDMSV